MWKQKVFVLVVILAMINTALLAMILIPQVKQVKQQIEQLEAVETGGFTPTFHDYYYEYVLIDSHFEGQWQIDTYKEVKRLVDENGLKIRDVDTGNFEYMRYFKGADTDAIILDLMEDDENHLHGEDDHS